MTDNKKAVADFEAEAAKWEKLGASKRKALETITADLDALTGKMLEAKDSERPAMIARRVELCANRDALQAEIRAALSRRDAATLAIYELEVSQAESEVHRLSELARLHRPALNHALDALRVLNNGGGGKLTEAERDKVVLETEILAARLKSEGAILRRDAERADAILETAKNELHEVQAELGVEVQP